MNEDQQEALKPEVETETTQTESPTEEQTAEDTQKVVQKKGANSRIRELNSEVHSLRDKIAELTNPVGSSGTQMPPFTPQEIASEDGSIDPQEFKRQVLHEANQMIDFRTRQAQVIERINRESAEVVDKFPELDPESEHFDQELSDAIYEAVEAKVKSDPTASVKQFVSKQMKLYKREASREAAGEQATVSKQVAQSAIKPSQNKPADTRFEDLSIEEMRNKLGYAE